MREDTIAAFLDQLAARVPAPGGGATAALHAAQAAALLAMVARYSDGARYDAALMGRIVAEADELRSTALGLAEADAAAFGAVAAAYQLPRSADERSSSIAVALAGAARPPADVVRLALRLVALAEDLLVSGNRNVITDVGAAAEAARAAAVTARLNIEVNLRGITDPALRDSLAETVGVGDAVVARADQVVAAVRAEITRGARDPAADAAAGPGAAG